MKRQMLPTAPLCGVMLRSGCGGMPAPEGSAPPKAGGGQPLSEMERLILQTQAWEEAGTCDDQGARRNREGRIEDWNRHRPEDGCRYIMVCLRGVGGPMSCSCETSLIRRCDGTDIAVFPFLPNEVYAASGTLTLYLRDTGTEEAPFFQLLGYELPV